MKFFTRLFLVSSILLASLVFASTYRIDSGTRVLSEQEKKEILDTPQNEVLVTKQYTNAISNQIPAIAIAHHTHFITSLSVLNDFIIIEDGSEWSVKPAYANEITTWYNNDPILIYINDSFISSFFQGYKYKMYNSRTNTTIEVKIHLGPVLNNPYTLQIAALNPRTYEVVLSDNSLWQCNPSEYKLFNKWLPGDGIIVGSNVKGWFNTTYDNILINVNMLEEIKANRLE